VITLLDSSGATICDGYMAIESLSENKNNRNVIFENLGVDTSGSTYYGPHFTDDFYVSGSNTGHFLTTGYWISYYSSDIAYYIQNLGNRNRLFEVKGTIIETGSTLGTGCVKMRNIMGQTGSISSEFIDSTNIFYYQVDLNNKEPSQVKFVLKFVEI